jgi:hypothetical protein
VDFDEFKASLRDLKKQFKDIHGLAWGKPRLAPEHDPFGGEMLGWTCVWVVTFEHSTDFIRLKENWKLARRADYKRNFFTYHYGPYEIHWDLETVECRSVVVRIDGMNYSGRGYHIHDRAKEARIFQDQLDAPDLTKAQMDQFIKSVLELRYGKSVAEAFGLKFK